MSEDPQKDLQLLAMVAADIVKQMTQIAHENKITSFPFLSGCLQFGVNFGAGGRYSYSDTVSHLTGYHPAVKGAIMTDGYEWSASHFECFPRSLERSWLFGDDSSTWPKTDYEEE